MDDHFRYGGETEGKGPVVPRESSQRVEELKRVGSKAMASADAILSATLAVGTAKDPGYIGDILSNIPVDSIPNTPGPGNSAEIVSNVIESVGNFAASHPNPTVAVLGLSAVASVMGRSLIPRPNLGKIFGSGKKP